MKTKWPQFADDIFKCVCLYECLRIPIEISSKCGFQVGLVHNEPSLIQIMDWHRAGDKPLSEQKIVYFTGAYMRHSRSALITLTPYMVLPLFATRFAAHAGGTRVSFIQLLRLFWFDIKCSAWEISYRLIWKKFVNMLSVYAQSEKHRRFNWLIIAILT